ncbi:MAG: flagellar basal-body rod protein FlgG [Oceanicaulis sp.]|jgi:flagellar basal-body rod protein FlgG|uniref:flagellar basal-body rod protein FlgG n=1 Tax=Oceanicaulis TaxID=153232 RepID=UPI0003B304CE|nr:MULTISPECIES: flagellar basal-body rod protein FlgG [Oceanicaulis]MAP47978.1 flagellar basal-body rod protein FlgG [Oceanicaulis sp.]MBL4538550.1 flagellar basal-body rod protein FlgG [Oceanicaulis sp.]VXC73285.1 flagellar component of cell-distal portion of basal-body rod [Oceanicaulis sp. 350]HCR67146.1 flagellar basal-body rod protein FlgG [Oceanicaulis sp.]|tara:strand:- start:1180 stop:1965 length:786 start_codon:yes stop_codon:yes gene_type:complete
MRALSTAATGMEAQSLAVEVISHNLANMNTIAFKRQRAEFEDLLYQTVSQPGANSSDAGTIVPTGVQVGLGVNAGSVYRIAEQGGLSETGNSYDVAISGSGYFRVQMPDGNDAYTRAGNFSLSPNGEIVTADGYSVMPGIVVPAEARQVVINTQGQVQILLNGQPAPQVVGQLELATFPNEAGLEQIGDNLLLESAASGAPNLGAPTDPGFGQVRQGFVEVSNVDAVTEITSLIQAQRAYEMNARVITAADEMLATSSNLR